MPPQTTLEDKLEGVLETCKNPGEALSASSDALYYALKCTVCTSLMLEPYTLQCGHTFCKDCLKSWLKQIQEGVTTCPTCRKPIESEPYLSLALRELALVVVASNNIKYPEREIPPSALELDKVPRFLDHIVPPPKYDTDDDVYRCTQCHYEVEDDGHCSGCGRFYPSVAEGEGRDRDYTDDGDSEDEPDGNTNRAFGALVQRVLAGNDDDEEEDPSEIDPWEPITVLRETPNDTWKQFGCFLRDLRANYPNYCEREIGFESMDIPRDFPYEAPISRWSLLAGRRRVRLFGRYREWGRCWNSMVRSLSRNGEEVADPFVGLNEEQFRNAFTEFLAIVRSNFHTTGPFIPVSSSQVENGSQSTRNIRQLENWPFHIKRWNLFYEGTFIIESSLEENREGGINDNSDNESENESAGSLADFVSDDENESSDNDDFRPQTQSDGDDDDDDEDEDIEVDLSREHGDYDDDPMVVDGSSVNEDAMSSDGFDDDDIEVTEVRHKNRVVDDDSD